MIPHIDCPSPLYLPSLGYSKKKKKKKSGRILIAKNIGVKNEKIYANYYRFPNYAIVQELGLCVKYRGDAYL